MKLIFPLRALARGFTGRSCMPVYKLDKQTVTTPRARVRPLGNAAGKIEISSWRLAHAIKKADCAMDLPPEWLYVTSAGFLMEHFYLFDWSTGNLRLASGMANGYADSTRTSLAGRIAQGMTILFMEERGYAFAERFSSFLKRHNEPRPVAHQSRTRSGSAAARRKQDKTPDFVFEKHSHGGAPPERALAESKGGFVSPGGAPAIKGELRYALDQLDGWDQRLSPQINKSFAVGTFLREVDDKSREASLIAYVETEPRESQGLIECPPDTTRRANYAAWLTGMGTLAAAERLLGQPGAKEIRQRFPVIRLGHRKYAFSIASVRPTRRHDAIPGDEFWESLLRPKGWLLWLNLWGGFAFQIMGLELGTLRILGKASTTGNWDLLMHLEPVVERESFLDIDGGGFAGSIFTDGTVLGELQVFGSGPRLEHEEVVL